MAGTQIHAFSNTGVASPGAASALSEFVFGELGVEDSAIALLVNNPSSQTRQAVREATSTFADRGATRTIYVRADGNDSTGDGRSTGTAYREISTAVDALAADGAVLRGSVVINVGAGTYKGGITVPSARGRAQDDYLKIVGPGVGGHPNEPTAIVDMAADASASWGVYAADRTTIWLEDLKFTGGFPNAVRIERGVLAQLRNVHINGSSAGAVNGVNVQSGCMYFVLGGVIENCPGAGISEIFNNVRAFGLATSNAEALLIRSCGTGLHGKEGGTGHLDYLNVEDCETGVELNGMCVANMKSVSLKRNTLGVANVNSEIHNGQSMVWGTGADANTRDYIAVGSAAADLTDLGWVGGEYARTRSSGHRSLVTLAADYTDHTVTGVTAETTFAQLDDVVVPRRFNTAGKRLRIVAWGSVVTPPTTATGYRILLRIGGNIAGEVRVPQTAVTDDDFRAEFDVVCSADGNNQKVMGGIVGYPAVPTNYATRTLNLTDGAAQSVRLSAIPGGVSESVTIRLFEVWG